MINMAEEANYSRAMLFPQKQGQTVHKKKNDAE